MLSLSPFFYSLLPAYVENLKMMDLWGCMKKKKKKSKIQVRSQNCSLCSYANIIIKLGDFVLFSEVSDSTSKKKKKDLGGKTA